MCRFSFLLVVFACSIVLGAAAPSAPKPDGRLVDVGGRKLHLVCAGKGSPAVILEAGVGEFSFDWSLVQPSIARATRVCAYDRAGYAWSDMSPGFAQFDAVEQDMRELLRKAGVRPPYVLVGHAFGALYARDYQWRYPQEVAGLVLVDPTPEEDTQVVMFGKTVSLIDMADHDLKAWPVRPFAPSRTSPPPRRSTEKDVSYGTEPPFDKLPRSFQLAQDWALHRFFDELDGLSAQQAWAIMESERVTFSRLYDDRHNPKTSPLKIPVVVLSRGQDTTPETIAMQAELGRLSSDAVHRTVSGSGEQIELEQPQFVVNAVAEVVRAVRTGEALNWRTR